MLTIKMSCQLLMYFSVVLLMPFIGKEICLFFSSFLMIEMAYSRLVSLRSFIIFRLSAPVCLLHGTGKTALHQDDHMEKRELKKPTLIPGFLHLKSIF